MVPKILLKTASAYWAVIAASLSKSLSIMVFLKFFFHFRSAWGCQQSIVYYPALRAKISNHRGWCVSRFGVEWPPSFSNMQSWALAPMWRCQIFTNYRMSRSHPNFLHTSLVCFIVCPFFSWSRLIIDAGYDANFWCLCMDLQILELQKISNWAE